MTDENTRLPNELLPCQADRERAATIAPPGLREGILSGQMDGGKYVRAFTAHRNDASTLPSDSVVEDAAHRIYDAVRPHSGLAYWICELAAKAALAAQPRDDGWQPMDSAPLDGTDIQARIPGNGSDNVIAWQNEAFLNDDNEWCGGWAFTTEQEPPDCWTDGVCWSVNEDGVPSLQPSHWKHLPDTALSQTDEQPDTDCAVSKCTKCGAEYPSAPDGTIHKCGMCSGGYCAPVEQPDTQGAAYRIPSLSDRERVFANEPYDPPCTVQPEGWRCTRKPGHEGPCAAVPETDRIDTQPDTDGLLEEMRQEFEQRFWSIVDPNSVPSDMWEALNRLAQSYRTRTDRKAALEEAAKVADEIAEEWGKRWQYTSDKHETYENGRIAGWSDGAADVAKQIRLFAKESTQ